MIVLILLILLGLSAVYWNRIILWITFQRMGYRHVITSMKIELLKALHEIGLL